MVLSVLVFLSVLIMINVLIEIMCVDLMLIDLGGSVFVIVEEEGV